jgi:N-acetylneuraminate synthase
LDSYRESSWGDTQRAQKDGLEFDYHDYKEIDEYCKNKGIEWFASAWDLDSQTFLEQFNCKYNKVASAMIVYEELLGMIAKEGKHTFISTGMSTFNDIQKAVDIFNSEGCSFELMHTVSTYPMKVENANLNMINTLREKFHCNIGYSGHESGLAESYAAAALGITSLERHITLDRSMYGSDQSASVEPAGFKQLVGAVRKIEVAMGDGVKRIVEDEIPIAKNLRQHLKWKGEIIQGK